MLAPSPPNISKILPNGLVKQLLQLPPPLFTNSPGLEPLEACFCSSRGSPAHFSWEIKSNLETGKPAHREKNRKWLFLPRTKTFQHSQLLVLQGRKDAAKETSILAFEENIREGMALATAK